MDENEIKAVNFFTNYGLIAKKIPESTSNGVKTPDFKVFSGADFAFFAEVKTLDPDTRLQEALVAVEPLQTAEVSESVYNRIASNIKNAGRQFIEVNPKHEYPNVLVLVNKRDCDLSDLHMVLEGVNVPGISITVIGPDTRTQMQEGIEQIDAYVWLDDNGQSHILSNTSESSLTLDAVCNAFGTSAKALYLAPPIAHIS